MNSTYSKYQPTKGDVTHKSAQVTLVDDAKSDEENKQSKSIRQIDAQQNVQRQLGSASNAKKIEINFVEEKEGEEDGESPKVAKKKRRGSVNEGLTQDSYDEEDEEDLDDADDPVKQAEYKRQILEWVTNADFTREVSLAKIAKHRFRLDDDEISYSYNNETLLKILKV